MKKTTTVPQGPHGHFANRLLASVVGIDGHRRLAAGLALGCVIGCLPKDSLFPVAIALIGLLSTANLLSMILGAVVTSLIAPNFDWLFDRIGFGLLSQPMLQPLLAEMSAWPVVAWTRLENTVVTGSFIVGIVLFWPVYLSGCLFFKFYRPKLILFFNNYKSTRWLTNGNLG